MTYTTAMSFNNGLRAIAMRTVRPPVPFLYSRSWLSMTVKILEIRTLAFSFPTPPCRASFCFTSRRINLGAMDDEAHSLTDPGFERFWLRPQIPDSATQMWGELLPFVGAVNGHWPRCHNWGASVFCTWRNEDDPIKLYFYIFLFSDHDRKDRF